MTTQISLYNNALILLGERTLSGLTEAREPRRLLDTVWARPATKDCLEQGQWNFAMRSVEINSSPSVSPSFGYTYAFDRPTDLVRTCAVCSDEYFEVPLLRYQTEGAYWFADIDPLYVRYVSNDASYGLDLAGWPGNFCRFVEAYLAEAICERVTGDKEVWARVRKALTDNKTLALATDAMEQPTEIPPPGSWVRSRGRGNAGDRGRRNQLIG